MIQLTCFEFWNFKSLLFFYLFIHVHIFAYLLMEMFMIGTPFTMHYMKVLIMWLTYDAEIEKLVSSLPGLFRVHCHRLLWRWRHVSYALQPIEVFGKLEHCISCTVWLACSRYFCNAPMICLCCTGQKLSRRLMVFIFRKRLALS